MTVATSTAPALTATLCLVRRMPHVSTVFALRLLPICTVILKQLEQAIGALTRDATGQTWHAYYQNMIELLNDNGYAAAATRSRHAECQHCRECGGPALHLQAACA